MLLGQDLGGCHQRALPAGIHAHRRSQRGHHGLARAHIALQQSMHRLRQGQVLRDLLDHALLRAGQPEGQGAEQLLMQATARAA